MLNFFIKQKQVKHLEYEPFDKDNPEDKKKELTLEEKKMIEKFLSSKTLKEITFTITDLDPNILNLSRFNPKSVLTQA